MAQNHKPFSDQHDQEYPLHIFINHLYYICKYSSCIILSNNADPYCVKTALIKGYRLSQVHRTLASLNPGISSVDNVIFVSVGTNDSYCLDCRLGMFRLEFLDFILFMSHSFHL